MIASTPEAILARIVSACALGAGWHYAEWAVIAAACVLYLVQEMIEAVEASDDRG